jgi:type II secretory pathway component PulM
MRVLEKIRSSLLLRLSPWQAKANEWLEDALMPRYRQLASREKRLILFTAVLLPLMLLWFGLVSPLHDRKQSLLAEVIVLKQQAMVAQSLAGKISQQGNVGNAARPANLLASVERLARQLQLREYMTHIRPQPVVNGPQRLMLELKDAPYDRVLSFSHALALENLELDSIKIQFGSSAGLVDVRTVIVGK